MPHKRWASTSEQQGEPTSLIDAWCGRSAVVVADAMRSGSAAGTLPEIAALVLDEARR